VNAEGVEPSTFRAVI